MPFPWPSQNADNTSFFLFLCPLSSASKDGVHSLSIALRSSDKRENVSRVCITAGLKDKALVFLESFFQTMQITIHLSFIVATVLKNQKPTCLRVYFSGTIWKIRKAKEQLPVEIITVIKRNCICS